MRRVLILVVFLIGLAFIAGHEPAAQGTQLPSLRGGVLTLTQPVVLAGPDVGFRVVRMDGQIPVGQIVVRINGAWVAADTAR
jgi:hypothetical protein